MFHFHTLIQQKAQHFPRFRQKKQNIFVGFTFFRNILPGSSTKCKTFSQVPAQIANHFPRFQHKYQNIFTGSEKKKFEKKKKIQKKCFFFHTKQTIPPGSSSCSASSPWFRRGTAALPGSRPSSVPGRLSALSKPRRRP